MSRYKTLRILFTAIALLTLVMACYLYYYKNEKMYAGIMLAITAGSLLNIADVIRQERKYRDSLEETG